MNLKNITLKTAELGPVKWEDVEKLQPGENGFICFISAEEVIDIDPEGEETTNLLGTYFETEFTNKPSYKELINFIISKEYPNGKESEMLRYGIMDPQDEEYLSYYDNVEDIVSTIKSLFNKKN